MLASPILNSVDGWNRCIGDTAPQPPCISESRFGVPEADCQTAFEIPQRENGYPSRILTVGSRVRQYYQRLVRFRNQGRWLKPFVNKSQHTLSLFHVTDSEKRRLLQRFHKLETFLKNAIWNFLGDSIMY